MSAPKGEPILIDCEGGGYPPATTAFLANHYLGMCAMCGRYFRVEDADGRTDPPIVTHMRDDIVARIERGDFG